MQSAIVWYLWIVGLGIIGIPITHLIFNALPSKGYTFSKIVSLFLWGVLFWLLSNYGILTNNLGGQFFAIALVAGISFWATTKIGWDKLLTWIKSNQSLIIKTEIVFILFFLALVILRGFAPGLDGTEKPMELAFINAILSSPTMPPHDPWLANYSISYYYLGYIFTALLILVNGVTTGIGFNLMLSTIFALTAIASYGIVFDLLTLWKPEKRNKFLYLAILSPMFILLVSNGEGFLEILHHTGAFWKETSEGQFTSAFWQDTVGIKNLDSPPSILFDGNEETERRFWWWWRASRVVRDLTYPIIEDISRDEVPDNMVWFQGDAVGDVEVIDEFPFFAFHLGDLHPHVLTMPFAIMAIAFTLQVFMASNIQPIKFSRITMYLSLPTLIFSILLLGGIAFLNLWDIPLYLGLFTLGLLFKTYRITSDWQATISSTGWTMGIIIVGIIAFYFPFFYGFASQAGGILPNLIHPTRTSQLWLMWGTLITPILIFLLYMNIDSKKSKKILPSIGVGITIVLGLWALSTTMANLVVNLIPNLNPNNPALQNAGQGLLSPFFYQGRILAEILQEGLLRRQNALGSMVTIVAIFSLSLHFLPAIKPSNQPKKTSLSFQFVILLIIAGTFLVLGPEFLYLRDNFGTRMNTVFKFYSQAWILWGLAAGFGSAILLSSSRKWFSFYLPFFFITIYVGLSYPAMAVQTTFNGKFQDPIDFKTLIENWEIDGTANTESHRYGYLSSPGDQAAAEWLANAPQGILVEAVGGSYSGAARIATHSGQIGLLGWTFHEIQWRGGADEIGSREIDIDTIYSSGSWVETQQLLEKYNVSYVVIGNLEFITYPNLAIGKFIKNLGEPVLFENDTYIFVIP
jgi:YYY domain-containing protein